MKRSFLIIILSITPVLLHAQKKTASASGMLLGKDIYTKHCMTCHQVDGTGAQNMIPPLIKTSYVLGPKSTLIKILLNGLNGEININGDVYAGEMPSQAILKDEEIAAVLTYVRNNFGNTASFVTTSDVKKIRNRLKK